MNCESSGLQGFVAGSSAFFSLASPLQYTDSNSHNLSLVFPGKWPPFLFQEFEMLHLESPPDPTQVAFISDLHLFSSRSTATDHMDGILSAANDAEYIILGGDLFDFRWSRVGAHHHTADAAIEWLESFIASVESGKQFFYLYGNHDGDGQLRNALRAWADQKDHFQVAGDLLRIGNTVFLHGDAIEANGDLERFSAYRSRWANKPQANMAQSRAYDAAITVGAHRVAAVLAHSKKRTCRRLLHYLSHHDCGHEHGIRRVVFGHTHRFLPGKWHDGVRFYNPGATIRGVPFQPVLLKTEST